MTALSEAHHDIVCLFIGALRRALGQGRIVDALGWEIRPILGSIMELRMVLTRNSLDTEHGNLLKV